MNISTPYKVIVIGMSLKDQFSQSLNVSANQIVVPDKLSKGLMSYIYKTREERNDKELIKLILQHLNLKFRTTDSLMEVMQLQVVDKELFKKYALTTASSPYSRSIWTKTYAAISNDSFSKLKAPIEEVFNIVVVLKDEGNFKKKMSMTIKIDNLENLKSSLKSYGIEVSSAKKNYLYINLNLLISR